MEPLQIQCRPANAILWYDRWMPLDGILARAWMIDRYREDFYALPTISSVSPDIDLIDMDLPLKRIGSGELWYWAASWADMDAATLQQERSAWVRGYPTSDAVHRVAPGAGRRSATVITVAGSDKLYNIPIYLRIMDTLTWYAVGDIDRIRQLLAWIPHIGKKCGAGWGQLMQYADGSYWKIQEWPQDWSERNATGSLMRGVPVALPPPPIPGNYRFYGFRAPYFVRQNQSLLEMP
jgi:CRISPR type IV-associated protein Csf3